MTTLQAVKKLKSFFPNKYVSIREECDMYNGDNVNTSYSGYVEGYDYESGAKSFDEVITHFTRRLIMDRTFATHFVTTRCESAFCDALNKSF